MRRTVDVLVVATVALVGLGAASLSSQFRHPSSISQDRLTSEVFADPADSECVALELAASGRPLERMAAMLGDESAGTLSVEEQEQIAVIIAECLAEPIEATPESSTVGLVAERTVAPASDSLTRAEELPDGELPEQPVVEVRVDDELPLAANNLD